MARFHPRQSYQDWALAAEACIHLVAAALALRLLPFSWLTASLSDRARGEMNERQVLRIAWAVNAAAHRLPLRLTCLRRAFAAAWMLKARGLAPRLHYGVATTEGEGFESHAWVEVDGLPVIGHQTAYRFSLLASFPPVKRGG